MEIDLLDPIHTCDHYIIKNLLLLAKMYNSLTKRLTVKKKLISELLTRECLATTVFPNFIAQYWQLF
jgi:mannitol/fructose-specific phosphotransferase system IIA component